MKLRMNKFTMVCAVVLSSAVLFGTNSVNVQAAGDGAGSTIAVNKDQSKEDGYVDGETASNGNNWTGMSWAVYKDENNGDLQLRLGNPDATTVEKLGQSQGTADFDWMKYASRITSVVIVGKIKANIYQESVFEGLDNAKTISGLSLFQTSDTSYFQNMFKDDAKLESLDISSWDMSAAKYTNDMFVGTHLSSLTLGPNSVIRNSTLTPESTDPFSYNLNGKTYMANGWKDVADTSSSPQVISTQGLMSRYTLGSDSRTQTTWVPNRILENIKYHVQYVDSSTGEVLPVKSDQTYDGVTDDKPVDLATITNDKLTLGQIIQLQPGYSADSVENKTGVIEDDGNDGYVVKAKIKKLDPVNISVSQTVGSDKPIDHSFKVPVNDTSYKYADIADPANATIDLNKSTIKIGDKDAEPFAKYSSTSKDLNSILSAAITSQYNKSNVFGDDSAGTTPITVNAVYTKKSTGGSSSSSGSHHNSNNNNESNTEDKGGTTTEVKQTISTTNKDVNLYDKDGKLITDRVLAENSAWFSDQTYDLNGTSYYRVANGEYVKASDVYIYTAENHIIDVKGKSIVFMVDSNGHKVTNRALGPNSEWYSDRYTIINGQKYYRVATDEFVSAADIALL
ncbi:BspA family leucine-rich repeat surface protein [Companilactobacillus zhachilii]|uniref:BspA family leucine-rich repeat surface protein n=1 Tax=Companilactobacillus zhachilii TaxID=2304606 RepID=A0A386PR66_9LACO|nr:SLAP domain-containing protein [Companilactobacillus zhachilii]AYE37832.1 BspA family leucine-rich repeat surface protein [Companilactobacillus zhachilii]